MDARYRLYLVYEREGGGGLKFFPKHGVKKLRTAAYESLCICRRLFPWRLEKLRLRR